VLRIGARCPEGEASTEQQECANCEPGCTPSVPRNFAILRRNAGLAIDSKAMLAIIGIDVIHSESSLNTL
jgi:hypothetical protein